jgi:cysteinyl-tRNA synthetase
MTISSTFLVTCVKKYLPHLFPEQLSVYLQKLVLREFLKDRVAQHPASLVEVDFGGWVPNSLGEKDLSRATVFAQEVHTRNWLRAVKDYTQADLIKRTLIGGGVELLDLTDGTIFYFSSVALLNA